MATPLPHRITGPKLGPFNGKLDNIQFKRLLNSEAAEHSTGSIPHSRVFQVSIEGKIFSLKVFNFFSVQELWPTLIGNEHLLNDNIVRHHLDPFYAECRAFGRLVEMNKDDELAVRCHGYVFLPRTIERQIERQFRISDWNRKAEDEGSPLRAIVKDYIKWKTLCHRKTFETMRKNLEELNDLGVYNMDIRKANYLGGRLFDFSIAATVPHFSFSMKFRHIDNILEDMADDLDFFDSMVEEVREAEELVRNQSSSWKNRTRAGTKSQNT
ncbi:kinetochore Sim4 complex subunit FTA2-domain-containing protein [Xylaria flabelliformis]|nr:kinetochore Sim4 complex subunit FTA2-domain-containing protein [Xylaria flabelliformis]